MIVWPAILLAARAIHARSGDLCDRCISCLKMSLSFAPYMYGRERFTKFKILRLFLPVTTRTHQEMR